MECAIGEFVVEGNPLISVATSGGLDEDTVDELNAVYLISRHRTVDQDAGFGIRQLVDIALKALSPGINDTTTAVMCVDWLGAVLVRLANREVETPFRTEGGVLRVIAEGPTFESMLALSVDEIRQNAAGNVSVLAALLETIRRVARVTSDPDRRRLLATHAELVAERAERGVESAHDRERLRHLASDAIGLMAVDIRDLTHGTASSQRS
jgi:uncharacterized membrane protein